MQSRLKSGYILLRATICVSRAFVGGSNGLDSIRTAARNITRTGACAKALWAGTLPPPPPACTVPFQRCTCRGLLGGFSQGGRRRGCCSGLTQEQAALQRHPRLHGCMRLHPAPPLLAHTHLLVPAGACVRTHLAAPEPPDGAHATAAHPSKPLMDATHSMGRSRRFSTCCLVGLQPAAPVRFPDQVDGSLRPASHPTDLWDPSPRSAKQAPFD